MPQVIFHDLGLIDYKHAWDLQEKLHKEIIESKLQKNNPGAQSGSSKAHNHLVFCEHPHVYTLGKTGKEDHLLIDADRLSENQASFYKINRGGDITYHGPGQLVGYPILDLENFFTDVHRYMRCLEEAVIRTLMHYGIEGGRIEKMTGVWIDVGKKDARKICAFGVRISRWVTMHGFALNVNTDLNYFNHIVPCGIQDKAVTSMQKETGSTVDMREVKALLKDHLASLFGYEYLTAGLENYLI